MQILSMLHTPFTFSAFHVSFLFTNKLHWRFTILSFFLFHNCVHHIASDTDDKTAVANAIFIILSENSGKLKKKRVVERRFIKRNK